MLRAASLRAVPGVAHGFTTRAGGVSTGLHGALNLARRPDEGDETLRENWRRALVALGPGFGEDALALAHQVHGAAVTHVATGAGPLGVVGAVDGLITTTPGVVLAIRTADCVPVLLAAPGGVGAAHAGWRGAVAGVVPATVAALCAATGARPDEVVAVIGPHISAAVYEVGDEVCAGLRAAGVPEVDFLRHGPRGRPHVDLGGAVAAQLRAVGVRDVTHVDGCTLGEPERFHSHRRDGAAAGRQAALVALCG